ncbi:winged helix-turn-helix domain-containing protein [Sinorhizobium meliloti]|uniref:winged helix-turn-helix domain-containing protein n=1 Tax=Rhizobium meliloti TaxID=382 RepID=UPI001F3175D4|nr:winged helix-turn-helix domain-containing protein [Sinorhizobium meliloti]
MAKSDKLFVTDAECAERIGIPTDEFKTVVATAAKSGFPMQDPLFKNRRYWPAVRAWLDRRYSLTTGSGPYAPDEVEPWKKALPGLDGKENWD